MAPSRDKWVRRFIIPETTRHKKGFTIYKVTSVVFLKSSHEEISKVSVWKRYNDFKKLHSELNGLYSQSKIKESFPPFPKPKFFGRFETEVIEERRECALKFLEFIGRYSFLYSSDIFIKFFETSHTDYCLNDCSQSLSSDTSAEEDRHAYTNSLSNNDNVPQSILQPKNIQNSLTNLSVSKNEIKQSQEQSESIAKTLQQNDLKYKTENENVSMTKNICNNLLIENNDPSKITSKLEDKQLIYNRNNNCYKDENYNVKSESGSTDIQTSNITEDFNSSVNAHDGSDLPQSWPDSSQYILVAAAHMSAAFKHEDLTEYEEAFTQYKMGISSLCSGVESDSNKTRVEIIKEKISKYLVRAEKLYNRYLNCNVSLLNKPISELQYYKVLKIVKSVMLVKDVRQNCLSIVKVIEKLSSTKENISNYILRGEIPYMVRLHAYVETETSIFLILQHLSRGKLWDFIASYYNSNNNENNNNNKVITKNIEKTKDHKNLILNENDIKHEIENDTLQENLNLISTNNRVQMKIHPITVKEKYEKYTDMSTTQLLENAQILLQSVNATLIESNSVASRLCEADRLINHKNNTSILNLKNSVYESKNCDEVLVDINDISLDIDEVTTKIRKEKIPEKNVITSNCLSQNNITNIKSQCSSMKSSLNSNYKNLNFKEKESTNFLTGCELNRSIGIRSQMEVNNYCLSNDQHNSFLFESKKSSNTDAEQELWTIPENTVHLWAAEILLALEALHQQEVIIFDLKPDNILLDDNGHVKLTYIIPRHDVDLVKYKHPYSSPELCTFSPIIPLTSATDIWSFGVILYELIIGNKFEAMHPSVFHSHSTINIPSRLSENAKSLLLNILKYEPNERMTIPEIKQHPFFKNINWSSLVNTL